MLSGIVTALALISFVAIVLWAYSAAREAEFDHAARLPFDDGAEDGQ